MKRTYTKAPIVVLQARLSFSFGGGDAKISLALHRRLETLRRSANNFLYRVLSNE